MTTWSTSTFHDTSEINNGNQYTTDDNLSIDALNKAIENSFYNVNNSKTQVTKDGSNIGTWDATFADAEKTKSNNASYGAIVHQKEMEGFAQPLAKYNEFIDINSSTLTTLAEYLTYFKQNYPKCFKVRIGSAETSNFKTIVGTPTNFGNYVNCFIHPKQQGTSTGASGFFELYAVNSNGSHFATGYMGEVYQSSSDTYKYFTGWHIIV